MSTVIVAKQIKTKKYKDFNVREGIFVSLWCGLILVERI